jgi:hypothetical protein
MWSGKEENRRQSSFPECVAEMQLGYQRDKPDNDMRAGRYPRWAALSDSATD